MVNTLTGESRTLDTGYNSFTKGIAYSIDGKKVLYFHHAFNLSIIRNISFNFVQLHSIWFNWNNFLSTFQ